MVDRLHVGHVSLILGFLSVQALLTARDYRRLSTSQGLPAGLNNVQNLNFGLPGPSAAFQSPTALLINLKIARVTGDIMSCML